MNCYYVIAHIDETMDKSCRDRETKIISENNCSKLKPPHINENAHEYADIKCRQHIQQTHTHSHVHTTYTLAAIINNKLDDLINLSLL